jgi:hypothetical protein
MYVKKYNFFFEEQAKSLLIFHKMNKKDLQRASSRALTNLYIGVVIKRKNEEF